MMVNVISFARSTMQRIANNNVNAVIALNALNAVNAVNDYIV